MGKQHTIITVSVLILLMGSFLIIPRLFGMVTSKQLSGMPTVFVHGYKGTFNSFANMLKRFEDQDWGKKVLVYHISKKGKISVTHSVDIDDSQAYKIGR